MFINWQPFEQSGFNERLDISGKLWDGIKWLQKPDTAGLGWVARHCRVWSIRVYERCQTDHEYLHR